MSPAPWKTRASAFAILTGGVVAGILDITFAFIYYGMRGSTPVQILQSVASGLLGARSFEGGIATAALGAVLQLIIPTFAAAVYFAFSRSFPVLRHHAIASGLVFGIVVFAVMNFVVVPLSAAPFKPRFPLAVLVPVVLNHMFFVGLPIALANRKYLQEG